MHTEILSIGDELLTGALVDTNSAYIAEQCEIAGLEVTRHHCVGDNLENLVATLKEISSRADIAIVTGGLGPTLDDLTREAAAQAKGVELVLFPEALAAIEEFFMRVIGSMPESNERQALFPQGAQYIPNPIGTAPGFSCLIGKTEFFFTPGVPREVKGMLNEQIFPQIRKKFGAALFPLTIKTISTFGLSEATVGNHLEALAKSFPQITFGTRAHFPETQIKLYARNTSNDNAQSLLEAAMAAVNAQLKEWIFSVNNEKMETVVGNLLLQEKATLAVIGSSCGGCGATAADWLTNVDNSASFLSLAGTADLRRIAPLLLDPQTLTIQEAAKQIAQKVSALLGATYSIVIGGIDDEEAAQKFSAPPGTVYISINHKNSTHLYAYHIPFDNLEYKKRMAATLALDLLRRKILNLTPLTEMFGKPVQINP